MQTRAVPEQQSPATVSINILIFVEAVKDTLGGCRLEMLYACPLNICHVWK